jgi:protein-disulfide isomerase
MSLLLLAVLVMQLLVSVRLLLAVNDLRSKLFVPLENHDPGLAQELLGEYMNVSADDDPIWGEDCAPITIVGFSDYGCPYCGQAWEALKEVRARHGDQVRIVFRDFPLAEDGSPSFEAAEAAECANDQGKFLEMHDLLFEHSRELDVEHLKALASEIGLDVGQFEVCLDTGRHTEEVRQDREDGLTYGIRGTPTFFLNGKRLLTRASLSSFGEAIDELLSSPETKEKGECIKQE